MNMPEILESTQYLAQVRAEVSANLGTDANETDIVIVAALITTFLLLLIITVIGRKQTSVKADRLREQAEQEQKRQEAIQRAIQIREQNLKQQPRPSLPALPSTKPTIATAVQQTTAAINAPITLASTPQFSAHVPQDSMLRRHYISHVRTMLSAINPPRSSDFMLCRHYDQLITSQLEHCLTDHAALAKLFSRYQADKISINTVQIQAETSKAVCIPQDSMLKRHYLTHVRSMLEAVSFPRPTDFMLRRHYEQLITTELNACLDSRVKMESLLNRYAKHQVNLAAIAVPTKAIQVSNKLQTEAVLMAEKPFVPEDVTLKRHYVSNLRAMFESLILSRPTDCVLRRHYEQFVNSQIEDCLNNKSQFEHLIHCYEEFKHNLLLENNHSHSH